jgi:hypothetical protein
VKIGFFGVNTKKRESKRILPAVIVCRQRRWKRRKKQPGKHDFSIASVRSRKQKNDSRQSAAAFEKSVGYRLLLSGIFSLEGCLFWLLRVPGKNIRKYLH